MDYSITKKRDYAWMSQASYLDFEGLLAGDENSLKLKLKNKAINEAKILAEEQINTFVDSNTGYQFVNHQANTDSGFSATIFKSNADGSYTFAVRGTEPPEDGNEDQSFIDLAAADGLGVVLEGKAVNQLIDGYRYYKMATATGPYASYTPQARVGQWHKLYQNRQLTTKAIMHDVASNEN